LGGSELVIELPPSGTLIRDLTVTAVNMLEKFGGVKISVDREEGRVKVKASHPNLESALWSFSNELINIYDIKSEVVRWPPLKKNDRETLQKVIPQDKLKNLGNYGDVARYYVERLPELLGKGGMLEVKVDGSKSKTSVRLSQKGRKDRKDIAMLQLFKSEWYEGGLVFNRPYNLKVEIKLDESWASLLLSGFILSYTGMANIDTKVIEVSLLTIPEIAYDPYQRKLWLALNLATTLRRVPTNPTIPYVLYTYIIAILLEDPSIRKALLAEVPEGLEPLNRILSKGNRIRQDADVLLRIHRIRTAQNVRDQTFTEVSRENLMMGEGVMKLADLCIERDCPCLREIKDLIEEGSEARILNAITILYEALIGSKNPAEASYYIVRTIGDLEGEASVSRRCAERLVEVLTGIRVTS